MNNQPGLSIFQGSELINLNTNVSQEEEEEARVDELKRKEELKNILESELDEFDEEIDRSSIISSQNPNYTHNFDQNDIEGKSKDMHLFNSNVHFQENTPIYRNYENEILNTQYIHNQNDNIYTNENYTRITGDSTPKEYILNKNTRFENGQYYTTPKTSHLLGAGDYLPPDTSNYISNVNENGNPGVSAHINHCFKKNNPECEENDKNDIYRKSDYNSKETLEVLLDVRLREVQRLTEQLHAQEEDHAKYKEEIFRKYALQEAELKRTIHSREENQKKLVSKELKEKELLREIEKYKTHSENYEKQNKQLSLDLETTRLSHTDLQQKLVLLQRDRLPEKHIDSHIKSLKERYEKQIKSLEHELESIKSKFTSKNEECDSLTTRITELTRSHEVLLIEKADTTNQLMRNLEMSQKQCTQLMSSNLSQENIKLKMQLDDAKADRDRFSEKLGLIATELEATREELKCYERVASLGVLNTDLNTDSIIQLGLKNETIRNTNSDKDTFENLKQEIQQLLSSNKLKRDEIQRLNNFLESKTNQIDEMKKQEENYTKQIIQLEENLVNYENIYIKNQKNDEGIQCCLDSKTDNRETIFKLTETLKRVSELEEINKDLKDQLDKSLKDLEQAKAKIIDECGSEYLQFHERTLAKVRSERDSQLHRQIIDLSVQLEEALKENQQVKEFYVELTKTKEMLVIQLKTEQETISDLTTRLNDLAENLLGCSNQNMVVVNPATPSLNGQLVTVQGRVHELIVQLRKEQETSKRLSLELETARTALDEANKRLLQTPTNKHQLNQEDAIEKMRIMEKAVKEKFEEYKHIVNEYKKAIWNLKSERDVLQERLTNSMKNENELKEQLVKKTKTENIALSPIKELSNQPSDNRPLCLDVATSPMLPHKEALLENKIKQFSREATLIKNKYLEEFAQIDKKLKEVTCERDQLRDYIKNKSHEINEIQIQHQETLNKERKYSETIKKLVYKYRNASKKLTNQINLLHSFVDPLLKKIEALNINIEYDDNEYLTNIETHLKLLKDKLKNLPPI